MGDKIPVQSGLMTSTPQDPLAMARQLWRGGQYMPALQGFAAAARSGAEQEILALLRALLALNQLSEANRLVEFWRPRLTSSATLGAYHGLLKFASGEPAQALQTLNSLESSEPFSRAVNWALHAVTGEVKPPPKVPAWAQSIDGMAFLLTQRLKNWVGFPTQVLTVALANAPASGLCVECGVFWGRSIRQLAGGRDQVHGFDSFAGLPEDWKPGEAAGAYSTGGRLPQVPPNVLLYKGWFEQTLPRFVAEQNQPLALLHVDCDLYSSTVTVLTELAPLMVEGTVIVFDDFTGFDGWRDHEFRAFEEFCTGSSLEFGYLAAPILGREVAVQITRAPQVAR